MSDDEGKPPSECEDTLPADAYLMVTQHAWENDIMYYIPPATGPPVTAQGRERDRVIETERDRQRERERFKLCFATKVVYGQQLI